jgi:hypothetical protein
MKQRPVGVTILAILAGIVAVFAAVHTLQFLGILPFFIGEVPFRAVNFWYALMWGLMVWIYIWLVQMLWRVDPGAWLFLAVITTLNLILGLVSMIGNEPRWQDPAVSMLLNAVILIYCMLPGVKSAFGVNQMKGSM